MGEFLNLGDRIFLGDEVEGEYNIPKIKPIYELEHNIEWIQFNYAISTKKDKSKIGVQFFIQDQQFERVWNKPNRYSEFLSQFKVVMSPDFSLYSNYPRALQIYNHYRKHWVGRYWQEEFNIKVIPTICWSDESSYEWCFSGEPKHSIVAVSNVGCMLSNKGRELFNCGYNEMLKRLEPSRVLFLTYNDTKGYKGNIEYIKFSMDKKEQRE